MSGHQRDLTGLTHPFPQLRSSDLPLRKLEAIAPGFAVGARAGIAVPIPGTADVRAGLEHMGGHSDPLQVMDHPDAGEACADDDRFVKGAILLLRHATAPDLRRPPTRDRRRSLCA